jgi:hypothetical protein
MKCNCCGHELIEDLLGFWCPNEECRSVDGIIAVSVLGKYWYRNGALHREDGPAIEYFNGTKLWYQDGQLHRENGPALEYSDGTKYWYKNGKRHRENGPAIEFINGQTEYWIDDERIK